MVALATAEGCRGCLWTIRQTKRNSVHPPKPPGAQPCAGLRHLFCELAVGQRRARQVENRRRVGRCLCCA
jgi:hypothetical protein